MTQLISGHTGFIAHLGVPTESFRAPMIYNPYFEARGIDALVVPMGCEPEDYAALLPLLVRQRNFIGALVTMPHKVTTVDLLDETSIAVDICGACNAVKRGADGKLVGDMFDGEGFTRGLLKKGCLLQGASALIIGSGGVGSAIAAALCKAGIAHVGLYDINAESAARLADKLCRHYPQLRITLGSNDPAGWDVVTNATPLGMQPEDPMPLDVSRLDANTFVGEVVMAQEESAFLCAARERGCRTQIGTDMLFEQIPVYLEFFGLPLATAEELRTVARIHYQENTTMDLPKNHFKAALKEGRRQIGLWISIPDSGVVEMLAGCGYDWLLLDTEHSAMGPVETLPLMQAAAAYDVSTIVRPGWNNPVEIKKLLDCGAQSLLIPYVQNADEARDAVAAVRYPPAGIRGVAGMTRASGYGAVKDYAKHAHEEICLLVQVETMEALSNIEAIAAIDGVDGIFIGPADLAASMGYAGEPSHPEVKAAVIDAVQRIGKAGLPAGILSLDQSFLRDVADAGTVFIAVDTDASVLRRGALERSESWKS